MNDINVACARAATRPPAAEDEKKPPVEERLKKLDDLRSKQLVSEQEYQARRQQILDEL